MPTVRITWTDRNADEEGHRIYRDTAPIDTENLPVPLVELGPGATSYDDETAEAETTYHYLVTAYKGGFEAFAAEAVIDIDAGPEDDFANAQIGDYIGGGIYAGINTIGGTNYHIVSGLAESEEYGLRWKTSRTETAGTDSDSDGMANTLAMEAAGLADHPAAAHCLAYAGGGHNDWHMPAMDQLNLMHSNLSGHPEFADNVNSGDTTWSSTEASSTSAKIRKIGAPSIGTWSKDATVLRVRPVRRVPVNP